jgi:hypothetical protein
MEVELYFINNKTIKKVKLDDAIHKLYYQECRVPTDKELKAKKSKNNNNDIKKILSSYDSYIPLYDIFTSNIYIISKRNVYKRVVDHNYRFPDKLIMKNIIDKMNHSKQKLKTNDELKNDKVFIRGIRKAELMIEFISNFDMDLFYSTYLKVFYKYAPDIGNLTYTCMRKSFIPHISHLSPYYSKDEVIKLGMNMNIIKIPSKISYIDYKDNLTEKDYNDICEKIQENDITAKILIKHQNYIIKNNLVGLVQYYTVQGSYFMNQYMRGFTKYSYKNDYLEEHIETMWKLVLEAPPFDNDYILYRFVKDDEYLRHLKIGDVYIENGFTSTTRDPFYRNDLFKFGFVLIKIRIPKNVKGIGLCLETLSHFPAEEEVILPPMSHIKLISRDDKCKYYHPDEEYMSNVKVRYEFKWIKNGEVKFPKRTKYNNDETQTIDFLELDHLKTTSIKEKIDIMINKYFDPMNRIKCNIGDKTFYVIAEWYDSTGAYEEMYSLKTSEGFLLYTIYEGYILFMIEIGEIDGNGVIKVNYYTKYSQLIRSKIMGDDNFIKFISSIANYFGIPNITIFADFISCDRLVDLIDKKEISRSRKKIKRTLKEIHKTNLIDNNIDNVILKKQRTFTNKNIVKNKDKKNKTNNTDSTQQYSGGSYCVDFYLYLKHNIKRYQDTNTLNVELQPKFSYRDLDLLKKKTPLDILRKEDRDEIYQIYIKTYKPNIKKQDDNISKFYIWMIENKCYLMDILETKINRLYGGDNLNNPFKNTAYTLDGLSYLYNRHLISTYNRYIIIDYNDERQLLKVPKNEYRIQR